MVFYINNKNALSIILGLIVGSIFGYFFREKCIKTYKGPDSSVIRLKTYCITEENGDQSCYKYKPIPIVGPIISKKTYF